jgi:NAD(P)-dependent dehydrogenase (short-subunit alcohol dehydrogenase family)
MKAYSVDSKVALVTGGARGIGLATARDLVARGAHVAIVGLDPDATAKAASGLGDQAIAVAADVTDAAAMTRVVETVVDRLGRLDIVVANAGVAPSPATTRTMNPSEFERVIDVNVLGVYRTVRPALPHVIANRGHVVVVASVYAFVNGVLMSPYAMSKAAVEQFGRSLRAELTQHGASAGVAYFGFIDTAMVRDGFGSPLAQRFEATFPRVLRGRLDPSVAGRVMVAGIERRAPRVVAPERWVVYSLLRGLLNPSLDRRTERNTAIQAILHDAEDQTRVLSTRSGTSDEVQELVEDA